MYMVYFERDMNLRKAYITSLGILNYVAVKVEGSDVIAGICNFHLDRLPLYEILSDKIYYNFCQENLLKLS